MTPNVPFTDAFKEVPPLPPSSNWPDWPGDRSQAPDVNETDTSTEQETVIEWGSMQALQEDIASQVAAANEFAVSLAARIVDSADVSLDAAARLGPNRVAELLTWSCSPPEVRETDGWHQ
jgi:hypothetical protein